jgi:predicted metal-binding protein
MDREKLEEALSALPLYVYFYLDPKSLEFSPRIRWICEHECPMYDKTWACPPGVGTVEQCKAKCLGYQNCLLVGTIVEAEDISDLHATLATRPEHEAVTNQVRQLMR